MASSLIQIRLDDDLKAEATALYEALGIDLPTAVRMFIKRSLMVKGIPFPMTLNEQEYKAESAVQAMQELSDAAKQNGTVNMTLDEINAEITAVRNTASSGGDNL